MTSPALMLLIPLLGVTFGYEPSSDADSGYDYIVQVEPDLLDRMRAGDAEALEANIPPEVMPIRRIRVVVGTEALPRELRAVTADTEIRRTAFRNDLDAATPGIDLLAQTGPAGGYGRSAAGFSGGPRNTASTAPPGTTAPAATTVPPIGNTPAEISRQLDAGFQTAERGFYDARDSVRGAVNTMGEQGQRAIDNGRQFVSDAVAPPEGQSLDRNGRPIDNLVDRTQNEFRNTTEAFRDSFDRTGQNVRDAFGSALPAATDPRNTPPVVETRTPAPNWNYRNDPARVAEERSVLSDDRQPVEPPPVQPTSTQDNTDYRNRQLQQSPPAGPVVTEAPPLSNGYREDPNLRFPAQPENTSSQMRPVPELGGNRNTGGIVNRMVEPNTIGSGPAAGNESWTQDGQFGGANRNRAEDWVLTGVANQDFVTSGGQAGRFDIPAIEVARPASDQQGRRAVNDLWRDDSSSQQAGNETPQSPGGGSTPAWILVLAVAIGSVVTNLFQWLNIVDMRNKYRVALRRNSPGFARSAA